MAHLALELFLWLLLAFTVGWLIGYLLRKWVGVGAVTPTPPLVKEADNLERISGVGPKLNNLLNERGITHFEHIANWTQKDIDLLDPHLKLKGRVVRDEWIQQAKLLADGNEEEFARLYGSGGLLDKRTGTRRSGTRTRRKKS